MSLPNNVTSISLSICLTAHPPIIYFHFLQSGDVPSSCHRELESELASVLSKKQFHRFVCLLTPQNTTLCKLLSLPSHIVQHSLILLFDIRFNHSSAAITIWPDFFLLKQHLIIQQESEEIESLLFSVWLFSGHISLLL